METKRITDEMVAQLTAPLPAEAITENKQKTFLSSIKPIYITQRLNEVFGYGNWRTKVDVVTEKDDGSTVVKTTLEIPEYGVYLEQYGGHQDRDLGDSYKSSATDALTKCASYLGIGLDVFMGKQTHKTPVLEPQPISKTKVPNNQTTFSVGINSWIIDKEHMNVDFKDMDNLTSKDELERFKSTFIDSLSDDERNKKRKEGALRAYEKNMKKFVS